MNANGDRFCNQCGAANRSVSKFCSRCGSRLPSVPSTSSSSSPNPHSTRILSTSSHATGLLNPATLLKQRYRVVRKIGEGGFSAVYLVKDLVFNTAPRVVKEMSMQASGSQPLDPLEVQQAITSFQQEALLLAGLTHPNLPCIYDYFEQQQRWYIVMDYINGQTLEERLAQAPGGKLSLGQVLPFAQQLCTILAYLHSQQPQIIFRDLKPANIMVTAEDHVYLIDFGIARLFKPGQANDTIALGSPGYAAPEQYGRSQSTPLSDIYSLGATLHHLLSGQDPSATPFQFAALTMLHGEPGGPTVATLIERMVQIPQNLRPQTIQEVKHVLQGAPGTSPLAPSPASAGQARPMLNGIGGATVIVAQAGGNYTSISEALQQVPEKTRILIRPGVYQESLVLEKQVELVGDGPRDQIILMSQQDSCIRMSTNTALVQDITIRGLAPDKATIDIPQGQLVLSECTVTSTTDAIHIHNQNTRPLIQRCIIRDSQAGIFVSNQGGGSIEDCDIFANTLPGIYVTTSGAPLVRSCKIHDGKGTGISVLEQGAGSFENCDIFANAYAGIGVTTGGTPSVRGCKIHDGKDAGIFVLEQGAGTFENCDIFANAYAGISVTTGGTPSVRGCKIHDGKNAGIFVAEQGMGTFEDCDIFANTSAGIGVKTGGVPVVRRCQIHDGENAGIFVAEQGTGTFENCETFRNQSGGLFVSRECHPVIRQCKFWDGKQQQ